MTPLRLRCKSDSGTHTIKAALSEASTLQELKEAIHAACGVAPLYQKIMYGYPPKPLDLSDTGASLKQLKVASGDTLIIEDKDVRKKIQKETAAQMERIEMKRKEVPADNSCLFYSVFFALNGSINKHNYDEAKQYRQRISSVVTSDTNKYSTAFLGKDPYEYGVWIQCDTSWGGGIELRILSELFQVEISAIDIQTVRCDNYGEDQCYGRRIFLLYDGTHYDPCYLDPGNSALPIQTIFQTNDDTALLKAIALAQDANRNRKYVDVKTFSIRCTTCQKCFSGQVEAQAHNKETGHQNFSQF